MEKQNAKILKPRVVYRKVVPRSHTIVGGFAGLLILIGIIESWFFFNLSLLETVILSVALLFFYVILLLFLLRPKLVKIVRQREVFQEREQSMSKKISNEIVARPITINVNNNTKSATKKKSSKKKTNSKRK